MLKVDAACMETQALQMRMIAKQLNDISSRVASVNQKLRWNTNISATVRSSLASYSNTISTLDDKASRLAGTLTNAAVQYTRAEDSAFSCAGEHAFPVDARLGVMDVTGWCRKPHPGMKPPGLADAFWDELQSNEFEHDLIAETIYEKLGDAAEWFRVSIGNSSLSGAYWLYTLLSSNKGIQKLNEEWDNIPSEFKDVFKEIAGEKDKSVYSAIDLTLDVISGKCDWDSLETFLKTVNVDGTHASAVTKTFQMIYAPEGTMKDLIDGMYAYQDEAVDEFLDGNIVDALVCCGKSIGSGLGAIGYGVGEVLTELASDAVDDFLDAVTLPVRFVRHFIPGEAGEAVYNLGDKLDAGVDKITGWISGLL